jgi:hypothetical protein
MQSCSLEGKERRMIGRKGKKKPYEKVEGRFERHGKMMNP